MISRTLIAAAVTAACTWPTLAAAARSDDTSDTGQWVVITPSSVDESAPWRAAESQRTRIPRQIASAPVQVATSGYSMPNPITPWSPNESGEMRYNEDMRMRAQHVASVEQRRVAVTRMEQERLAAIERERVAALERERTEREQAAADANAAAGVGSTASSSVDSTTAAAQPAPSTFTSSDATSNAPVDRREQPAQMDQSAALTDTRSSRSMSVAAAPSPGNAPADRPLGDASAPPADRPMSDSTSSAAVPSTSTEYRSSTRDVSSSSGATSGAGANASGRGPSDAVPPSMQNAAEATPGNAYVTMPGTSTQR